LIALIFFYIHKKIEQERRGAMTLNPCPTVAPLLSSFKTR